MSILEYFPKNLTPREIQKKILSEIEISLNSGYKKIILSAPTGVGKSAIGYAISKYLGSAFFVTKSKSLQDQYFNSFSDVLRVKGKSNFECLKLMEQKKIDDSELAFNEKLTCEKGICEEGKDEKGNKIFCKYRPKIKEFQDGTFKSTVCPYYEQKFEGLISDYSIWNYSSYFQLMKHNQRQYGEYLFKSIGIFDEAHSIESQIIQFIGMDITKKQLEECSIDISRYNLKEIEDILPLLDHMRQYYAQELAEMKKNKISTEDFKYSRFDNTISKIVDIRIEIDKDKENFVFTLGINDELNRVALSIKPIDISNYVNDFFQIDKQLFMSATIDKMSFAETTGFDPSEIKFIDTPKSPFPIENRRVEFLNMGKLGNKTDENIELKAIRKIDELLTMHQNERGLILTQSKSRCDKILKYLSSTNKKRTRMCHSENKNNKTQNEILEEHKNDESGVLLSSSLWEGIDLKDDLSRFQIIAKVPYQNMSDERVMKKMKKYPLWFNSQALMTMLQGFGRSIRSKDDWAKTYVIDSRINMLLGQTKNIIPEAYRDILYLEDNYAGLDEFLL